MLACAVLLTVASACDAIGDDVDAGDHEVDAGAGGGDAGEDAGRHEDAGSTDDGGEVEDGGSEVDAGRDDDAGVDGGADAGSADAGAPDGGRRDAGPDIFLAIGQSNMSGRAPIEMQDRGTISGVYLLRPGDATWELAQNPINKYTTGPDNVTSNRILLGPMWTFAKRLRMRRPSVTIGLVGNARGGTSLSQWMPGTDLFNKAVTRAKAAKQLGVLKGIIWHQGEGDSNAMSAWSTYVQRLSTMIAGFRAQLNDPNLLFVAGQIRQVPETAAFNAELLKLPNAVSNTRVVRSNGVTLLNDALHFDSPGQRLMGERYADQVIEVLYP